jgi:hypothetical protein
MKKAIRIAVTGLMAACIGAACYFSAYPYYVRWRAARFIDVIAQLRPGITTESQAREALRSYIPETERVVAAHWDIVSNQTIKATGYGYMFTNGGLSILHLSRPAELNASLYFRDGVLALKAVSLQKGSSTCCLVLVKEPDKAFDESPKDEGSLSVEERGAPAGQIIVNLRTDASGEDRRRAYAFNLDCLASTSHCDSANSLLPGLP